MYRDLDSFIIGGAQLTLSPLTRKFSYARAIPEWNSLPAEVIDQLSERGVKGQSE